MAENDSSSSVASVAIVVILLIALAVGYFVFVRGVSAKRGIDVNINVPDKVERPLQK
jgi:hypothetical protein